MIIVLRFSGLSGRLDEILVVGRAKSSESTGLKVDR